MTTLDVKAWEPDAIGCQISESSDRIKHYLSRDDIVLAYKKLVIISDRDKGIKAAIRDVVPFAQQVNCMKHIERNIESMYPVLGDSARKLLWQMARAHTLQGFRHYRDALRSVAPYVLSYFETSSLRFENWASCAMDFPCLGYKTDNIVESGNKSMQTLRKLPPLLAIIKIIEKWQIDLASRRAASPVYSPVLLREIKIRNHYGKQNKIVLNDTDVFQVDRG